MSEIINPFDLYFGQDGRPINAGSLYVGVAGLDPQTNPVDVFYDREMTIPAQQPLNISGGYVWNCCAPTKIFAAPADYSFKVLDRNGAQVFYCQNVEYLDEASRISYLASFTGAQLRTQADKNGDYIALEDFLLAGSVADNTAQVSAAITAAISSGKGIRCGSRGEIYCAGSINFSSIRNIDIQSDIRTDAQVIFGEFSNTALPSRIRLARVWNGTAVSSAPPATPVVKVFGLKNSAFESGDCNYFQLYADSTSVNTSSNAYNDFYFNGRIKKLELAESGAAVSWNNENRFWGGRLEILYITGINYVPNHNKFMNNTFEGADCDLRFVKTWNNQIYGARFESVAASAGVNFDANSHNNQIICTWSGLGDPRGQYVLPIPVVDNGMGNSVTHESNHVYDRVEIASVDRYTVAVSSATESASRNVAVNPIGQFLLGTKGLFVPSLRGFECPANRWIMLTDYVPVKLGDVGLYDMDFDGALVRPYIYVYDANMQPLTSEGAGGAYLKQVSLTYSAVNGSYTLVSNATSATLNSQPCVVQRSEVAFIRIGFYSTSANYYRRVACALYTKRINGTARALITQQNNTDLTIAGAPTSGYLSQGTRIYDTTAAAFRRVSYAFETRLAADATSGATSVTVTSAGTVANGDIVGILLPSGKPTGRQLADFLAQHLRLLQCQKLR